MICPSSDPGNTTGLSWLSYGNYVSLNGLNCLRTSSALMKINVPHLDPQVSLTAVALSLLFFVVITAHTSPSSE